MKKLIFSVVLAIVFAFGTTDAVQAQFSDNDNVTGEITLVQVLSATVTGAADFGAVEATGSQATYTLGSDGSVSGGSTQGTTSLAQLDITASSGQTVVFTISGNSDLGGEGITFDPVVYDSNSGGANSFTDSDELALSAQTTTLYIGGSMTVPGSASEGTHSGQATITVAYTGL